MKASSAGASPSVCSVLRIQLAAWS